MTRSPVFAANWKMNLGPTRAREFMRVFLSSYPPRGDRTVIFFPSALTFAAVRDAVGARTDIAIGVQNVAAHEQGAFTGENSAPIARDAGASVVLVGHSERRQVFGETDEETAKKFALVCENDLTPMLCVGETLAEREAGETDRVVRRQLGAGLSLVGVESLTACFVAYEPVWAIGTGRTAAPADASIVHAAIRGELERLGVRMSIPILYGGSVTAQNAADLLAAPGVDGLLVGGASLDPTGWQRIVST